MVYRGMYPEAISILNDLPAPSDRSDLAQKLTIESVALLRQQMLPLAEQRLDQAEYICKSAAYSSCGEVLQMRGIFDGKHQNLKQARRHFLDSLQFARADHDQFLEASAMLNLGWTAMQVERFDEALDWLDSAYKSSLVLGTEDLAEKSSGNLGWAYFNLGDKERALALFSDAEKNAVKLGNTREELKWQTANGYVYQSSGDLDRAVGPYRYALKLAEGLRSKEDIATSLEVLALLSVQQGRLDDAASYIDKATPLVHGGSDHLDELVLTLIQGELAAARHQDRQAESLFQAVERDPGSQTSMRLEAEHQLANLYERENKSKAADRTFRNTLTTFESARAQIGKEASKLSFFANATHIYDDYIQFLIQHGKAAEQALAVADQSRARTLEQGLGLIGDQTAFKPAVLHPPAIARKTDAILLFYWLGDKQSWLWAVTPQKTAVFPLPPRKDIETMVNRYREALLGPIDPLEPANPDGAALFKTLVAPAGDLIRPNADVVILTDGILSQLNFETLIAPSPAPHYWIEDATLTSAPSIYMLASATSSSRGDGRLLLFGDPVSPGPDFPELPQAPLEMQRLRGHFEPDSQAIFSRQAATAEAYLASNPQQYSYIHFVAHGIASRTDPLDSAIILSPDAATNQSFKLYARDIIQHPIRARLVTVSACSGSGSRSYSGEGLVGLSWAFLRAGAHNVIAALWEVSDQSTPILMDSLYQGLEKGLSPGVSLRNAKLALLHGQKGLQRPFYWAPFQLYTGR